MGEGIDQLAPNSEGIEDGAEWVSASDMMTGLMVIFLFIAITYMIHVRAENERMTEVAQTYQELHETLYTELLQEFEEDLPRWSARIDSTSLAVRFTEPDVLFLAGSAEIRPAFQEILRDFFPRYVGILYQDGFRNDIEEVRIEGHTSSEWQDLPLEEAYFHNMDLSQRRTRAVLQFVMSLFDNVSDTTTWLRSHFTANGLSSSRVILIDGGEDPIRSRRVEFRVRTNAERRIGQILRVGS